MEFHDRRNGSIIGHFDLNTMRPVFYKQNPAQPKTSSRSQAEPPPPPVRKPGSQTRSGAPLEDATRPQPNRFEPVKKKRAS